MGANLSYLIAVFFTTNSYKGMAVSSCKGHISPRPRGFTPALSAPWWINWATPGAYEALIDDKNVAKPRHALVAWWLIGVIDIYWISYHLGIAFILPASSCTSPANLPLSAYFPRLSTTTVSPS